MSASAVNVKMAHRPAEEPIDLDQAGSRAVSRRCRGRPRLTDSDRAQRRLESRKKYDVRRVYLGEAHKLWSELRRRTSLSDSGLAEYLILLNSTYGEKYQQKYCGYKCTLFSPPHFMHYKRASSNLSAVRTDRAVMLYLLVYCVRLTA